jgi:Holliday junction resolvasome RuvABC endonuclease subunit
MVKAILVLKTQLMPDEADALAVAICHAHSRSPWLSKLTG